MQQDVHFAELCLKSPLCWFTFPRGTGVALRRSDWKVCRSSWLFFFFFSTRWTFHVCEMSHLIFLYCSVCNRSTWLHVIWRSNVTQWLHVLTNQSQIVSFPLSIYQTVLPPCAVCSLQQHRLNWLNKWITSAQRNRDQLSRKVLHIITLLQILCFLLTCRVGSSSQLRFCNVFSASLLIFVPMTLKTVVVFCLFVLSRPG